MYDNPFEPGAHLFLEWDSVKTIYSNYCEKQNDTALPAIYVTEQIRILFNHAMQYFGSKHSVVQKMLSQTFDIYAEYQKVNAPQDKRLPWLKLYVDMANTIVKGDSKSSLVNVAELRELEAVLANYEKAGSGNWGGEIPEMKAGIGYLMSQDYAKADLEFVKARQELEKAAQVQGNQLSDTELERLKVLKELSVYSNYRFYFPKSMVIILDTDDQGYADSAGGDKNAAESLAESDLADLSQLVRDGSVVAACLIADLKTSGIKVSFDADVLQMAKKISDEAGFLKDHAITLKFTDHIKLMEGDESLLAKKHQAETNATSALELGQYYMEQGQSAEAKVWFEKALAGGAGEAAIILANSLVNQNDKSVAYKDREPFLKYLKQGVDAGSVYAAMQLADIYKNGRLGETNIKKALSYAVKSLELITVQEKESEFSPNMLVSNEVIWISIYGALNRLSDTRSEVDGQRALIDAIKSDESLIQSLQSAFDHMFSRIQSGTATSTDKILLRKFCNELSFETIIVAFEMPAYAKMLDLRLSMMNKLIDAKCFVAGSDDDVYLIKTRDYLLVERAKIHLRQDENDKALALAQTLQQHGNVKAADSNLLFGLIYFYMPGMQSKAAGYFEKVAQDSAATPQIRGAAAVYHAISNRLGEPSLLPQQGLGKNASKRKNEYDLEASVASLVFAKKELAKSMAGKETEISEMELALDELAAIIAHGNGTQRLLSVTVIGGKLTWPNAIAAKDVQAGQDYRQAWGSLAKRGSELAIEMLGWSMTDCETNGIPQEQIERWQKVYAGKDAVILELGYKVNGIGLNSKPNFEDWF